MKQTTKKLTILEQFQEQLANPEAENALRAHSEAHEALEAVREMEGAATEKINRLKAEQQKFDLYLRGGEFSEPINSLLAKKRQFVVDIEAAEADRKLIADPVLKGAELRAERAADAATGYVNTAIFAVRDRSPLQGMVDEVSAHIDEHYRAVAELFHAVKLRYGLHEHVTLGPTITRASQELRQLVNRAERS